MAAAAPPRGGCSRASGAKPLAHARASVDGAATRRFLRHLASTRPSAAGFSPLSRPLAEHLRYGVINLDKPVSCGWVAFS